MIENHHNTYDLYSGEELKIAERIQHLRCLMLIHSRIYYVLNNNLISDKDFDALAKELAKLQQEYPEISKNVDWYEAFADWDGSTGAFLPLDDPWVVAKTSRIFMGETKPKSKAKEAVMKAASPYKDPEVLPKIVETVMEEHKEENYQMNLEDFLEMA